MVERATPLAPGASHAGNPASGESLRAALARHGIDCVAPEWHSPPQSTKRGRGTLRGKTASGDVLKVRQLESATEAARLAALHANADLPCLPRVSQYGPFLVEEWIPGATLDAERARVRAEDVGALLGRLHAARLVDAPAQIETRASRVLALEQLSTLGALGELSPATVSSLREIVEDEDPMSTAPALIHLDFAPGNIVEDARGALHVIDTEWLNVGSPGADLGRTAALWSTDADTWRRFLDGYASVSPHEVRALRFWRIALAARTAVIRKDAAPEARRAVLAALLRIAETASHA